MVMARDKTIKFIQGSLFEEDYLIRTLGSLVSSPEIALTELVANAWDAGSTEVKIYIPEEYNQSWARKKSRIECIEIGTANSNQKRGVVLSSYIGG